MQIDGEEKQGGRRRERKRYREGERDREREGGGRERPRGRKLKFRRSSRLKRERQIMRYTDKENWER